MSKPHGTDGERHHFLHAGPLEAPFERFAIRLRQQGYRPLSIDAYRCSVAHFGHWISKRGVCVDDIGEHLLSRFNNHRCRCPGGRRMRSVSRRYVARVRRFVAFLAEGAERLEAPARPLASLPLLQFRVWLIEHRGLRERTVAGYEHWLRQVFRSLGEDPARYTAERIRNAIRIEAQRRSHAATSAMLTALRSYLRFLASRGLCRPDLDAAIPKVAHWRLSALPRYLMASEVERVLDSCDRCRPVGLRDRAILLLLARLGLRAGDIVGMRLDDLDWVRGLLRVRGKSRREVRLPLPQDVGDAILAYLERARPPLAVEQLFLCVPAPHRAFTTTPVVSAIVASALCRAGIDGAPSRGAHLLRHSAATAMLRGGASLDAVAAVLRHRSADTTAYYAKVDLAMLAPLALSWPEGVSC